MFLTKQLNGLCSRNPALLKTPWDTYIYNMNPYYVSIEIYIYNIYIIIITINISYKYAL